MSGLIQFINELSRPWADAMLRACCQGGLALMLAWLICHILPKMPASAKCWLWRLAYLKLLVTFLWFAPIGVPLLSPRAQSATGSSPARASTPAPNPDRATGSLPARAIVPSSSIDPVNTKTLADELPVAQVAHTLPARLQTTSILGIVWLAGVLVCMSRIVIDWRRMRILQHGSKPSHDQLALQSCCDDLVRQMRLHRAPLLFTSRHISSPVLIGPLRPRIILPENAACSPSQLRMLLAHELAHIRRRDLLWNWLAAICQSLFFFHPLVWLASREWRMHREVACDQAAISLAGSSPAEYGDALLRFTVSKQLAAGGTLAVAMAETFGNLERRLLAMRHIQIWSKRRWATAGAILFIFAAIGIIPWRVVAQPAPAGEKPPAAPASSTPRVADVVRAIGQPLGPATYAGQISAPTVRVAARTDGMVKEVAVKEGDRVTKSQVLVKLDDTKQKLAVMSQEVEYKNAATELERIRQMGSAAASSNRQRFESAVQLAQIALELRRQEMADMTITAPFAGVVSGIRIQTDEFASKGTVLLTLLDIEHLTARLEVPQTALTSIRKGMKVTVRVAAYPQDKFEGEIEMIAPEVLPASGTIRISARVANHEEKLRPGMSARVTTPTGE